jgi:catalase
MRTRNPKVDNTVEALLRLSTVADAERDFALKVYAEEGNWDLG